MLYFPHTKFFKKVTICLSALLFLSSCNTQNSNNSNNSTNSLNLQGLEIKFLIGSDLEEFCKQAAEKYNNTQPKLSNGQAFYLSCEAKGSGDVVQDVLALVKQLQAGTIQADAPEFPTLLSVDGEIYQSQLIYQTDRLFPGQNYIPGITDSPLIAYSPMVFMTTTELAPGLDKVDNLYTALVNAKNHQQLDASAPPIPISYVHTAPTRSNSGLQTLVAQFASVAGKLPEELTVADIKKHQGEVEQIQSKITRYGKSTRSLAESMVQNGVFWSSVGSVYESLVIAANSQGDSNQAKYQAVYPKASFSSNMRAILPTAPWVSAEEKEAAEKIIDYLRQSETQQIAANLGLRPGVPGVALGAKFSPQYGVQTKPTYESYRTPQPEVVEAMLTSWQVFAKKPSLVAVVVDTSGSMKGQKLAAMQNTLLNYVQNLGPKEKIALITFNSVINEPVIVDGSEQGKNLGVEYISSLVADGDTKLYDSSLYARNWLQKNLRPDAINAVLVLTDGVDSGSQISLDRLSEELKKSNFESQDRIAFFTVGYGEAGEFDPEALEKIAQINGGYYRPGNPKTISSLIADLQVEF
jgi:Ca-activated chloride channel homolog